MHEIDKGRHGQRCGLSRGAVPTTPARTLVVEREQGEVKRVLSGAVIVVAVVLGVFFRFEGLDRKVFWHDETYTQIFASGFQSRDWQAVLYSEELVDVEDVMRFRRHDPERSVLDTVRGLAQDEPQNPPLYYVLARLWVGACGDDPGALRCLSALFSLLALPAMYWLARELFRSKRAAWASVALLSLSPFFILYAQEARAYSLWSVFILASSAALLHACPKDAAGRRSGWALYIAFITLALYTSLSTLIVIAAHAAFVFFRGAKRAWALSVGAALLLFTPWAIWLVRHDDAVRASTAWSSEIVVPRAELVGHLALNISRTLVDLSADYDRPAGYLPAIFGTALFIFACGALVRAGDTRAKTFVLPLVLVPIFLLFGADLAFGGIRSLSSRYLVPSWLGLVLTLGFAMELVSSKSRWGIFASGLVGLVALSSAAYLSTKESVWTKGVSEHLPEVAAMIREANEPLVIGNRERHHPGNLLALSSMLAPGTKLQVITAVAEGYSLPQWSGDVFLWSPIDELRERLERESGREAWLLFEDEHISLWRFERIR